MIGISKPIVNRTCRIQVQKPGPSVPDGMGDYSEPWTGLTPEYVYAALEPATAGSLERMAAGTITSSATHLITIPFHPQVDNHCRVLFNDVVKQRVRTFNISSVINPEEANRELVLTCEEVLP